MRQNKFWSTMSGILVVLAVALMLPAGAAAASKYKVLHSFTGSDGANPYAGLISDAAGNLYGTTYSGGISSAGTVYKLTPNSNGSWTESVLHSFTGSDGANPYAGLIFDTAGNLYGTTLNGGGSHREGTVFKLKRNSDGSWTESVLYSFCHLTNCADGFVPNSRLIFDAAGNLYGTAGGGAYGVGAVFKLTPNSDGSWTESVLYSFAGADGDGPFAGLIFDAAGNLYGTTVGGGAHRRGIAFKLTPNSDGSWTESVLYSFCSLTNCADGSYPHGCLIFDSAGNLDGTTQQGGGAHRRGTVFKLAPNADGSWTESVLHSFQSGNPFDGLTLDAAGNLYGTTSQGGPADGGAVFKLSPQSDGSWGYSVLRFFYGKPALSPYAGVLLDNVGNLYGTTLNCGSGCQGVVFEITP